MGGIKPLKKLKARKRKGKITFTQSVHLVNKSQQNGDTLHRIQARPPADVAPTFRIKVRRK